MLTPLGPNDRRTVGNYRLRGKLGTGGMGTVFLGVSADGRPAAIKVIRSDLLDEPDFRARFRREVTAATRVRSNCVAQVLDADPDADEPWMATEYVEGANLMTAVTRNGRMRGNVLETLAVGLAEGLVAVHAVNIVHRDLKPQNILLSWEGPKIIDFGLARAEDLTSNTSTGNLIGTVAWMSPEQLNGDPASPASDIFNWGMCVAFAARGRHPFEAQTAAATAMRILSTEPALDGVPPELLPVVAAALSKDPLQRPSAVSVVATLTGQPLASPSEAEAAAQRMLAGWVPPASVPSPDDAPGSAARLVAAGTPPESAAPATAGQASAPPETDPRNRPAVAGLVTVDASGTGLPAPGVAGEVEPYAPAALAENPLEATTPLRQYRAEGSSSTPRAGGLAVLDVDAKTASRVPTGRPVPAPGTPSPGRARRRRRRRILLISLLALLAVATVAIAVPLSHRPGNPSAADRSTTSRLGEAGGLPEEGIANAAGSAAALPPGASGSTEPVSTPAGSGTPSAAGTGPTTATASDELPRATTTGQPIEASNPSTTVVTSPDGGPVSTYRGPATGALFGGTSGQVDNGQQVSVYCGIYAQQVSTGQTVSRLWFYTDQGWVPAGYITTGSDAPTEPPACAGTVRAPQVGSSAPRLDTGPFPLTQNYNVLAIVGGVVGSLTSFLLGNSQPVERLSAGDLVVLQCQQTDASGVIWDKLADGGWIQNTYVYSDRNGASPAPPC